MNDVFILPTFLVVPSPSTQCSYCNQCIDENKRVTFAIRVEGYVKFEEAFLCDDCSVDNLIVFSLTSTREKCKELFSHLQPGKDLEAILTQLKMKRNSLMKSIGKIHRLCAKCGKDDTKGYCSKCFCTRYCDPRCQLADWKKHKGECEIIQMCPIIYESGIKKVCSL